MEIRRPERGIRAVVDAGGEARGNVERAAYRDHEMREIAAHAAAAFVGVDGRCPGVARSDLETRALLYPAADRFHALVARRHRAEFLARDGKLRFVLTPRIGKAASYDGVPLPAVESVVRFAPQFFCDSGKANG